MYKHILVPTDGSPLSERAVAHAVELAKAAGARLTGLYVVPNYVAPDVPEGALAGVSIRDYVPQPEWDTRAAEVTASTLEPVKQAAARAGVSVDVLGEKNDDPWQAILAVANRLQCDCIVMASHGRRGIDALLLGSETNKVLTHGKLPVLVVK